MNRLGFRAMRLTGDGVWGPPPNRKGALAVLRRCVELDVNFIDTADSYGPLRASAWGGTFDSAAPRVKKQDTDLTGQIRVSPPVVKSP